MLSKTGIPTKFKGIGDNHDYLHPQLARMGDILGDILRRREDMGCNFTRDIAALTASPSVNLLWLEVFETPLQKPRRNWDPEDGRSSGVTTLKNVVWKAMGACRRRASIFQSGASSKSSAYFHTFIGFLVI